MDCLDGILAEVDFVSNCKTLIQKHYGAIPGEVGEQRKMFASLTRYGYSLSEIKAALQLILKEK